MNSEQWVVVSKEVDSSQIPVTSIIFRNISLLLTNTRLHTTKLATGNWQLATFLLLLVAFSACSKQQPVAAKPVLAVSILPQSWFVSRIAGDRVQTLVLVGPGQNPHSYEPTPRQMNELAQAKAWVLSGTEFEIGLLPKIKTLFPNLKIVDGVEGASLRLLEAHAENRHYERSGHHSEGMTGAEIDRHSWLGFSQSKILAAHIRDALVYIDPSGQEQYEENYEALVGEINLEFESLKEKLEPLRGRNVFVYHPSFGYFFDEFGINQVAVESGGKEPGPRELADLVALAKREKAAAIFVQAQFPANAAKTVANAVGARVISLDPLSADWLGNIRLIGKDLYEVAHNE